MALIGWLGNPKAQPSHKAYLPLIQNGLSFRIYDKYGTERDWPWLIENFGPVVVEPGIPGVIELREIEGPATLVADVGAVGVPVVFYWPDAPFLPSEFHNCDRDRGLVVYSKENGKAEFALGGGSYYFPPDPGIHWIWMQDSGCLGNIGMLGGTDHIHLDSRWK